VSHNPTPTQALLLFGLVANQSKSRQADLLPKVKKVDREALVRAKFITAAKVGRGLVLTLEDAGWAWVEEHFASVVLPPAQRTLANLLARLAEYLAKKEDTLANFIGAEPAEVTPSKSRKPTEWVNPETREPMASLSPEAVRERIEEAYLALTHGRKNQSVRLAQLRAKLADLDRNTVDAALGQILRGDKTASLMRHDDPRQLDPADHEAAFNPAGEPFHVIWISS
jgi:hypothetical protein